MSDQVIDVATLVKILTKTTPPRLTSLLCRERLFQSLDAGRDKGAIWISAQAGSGKTTLAASWLEARKLPCLWYQVDAGDGDLASFFYYLGQAAKNVAPKYRKPFPLFTPEYQLGVSVFTRRYFEELFRRLAPSTVVVFDNYQDAPYPSVFHDVIAQALETAPPGISIVILSRSRPPQQFARHLVNNRLHLIERGDIQFTLDESRQLIEKQGDKKISEALLSTIYSRTEGWVAGLVLLLARSAASQMNEHDLDDLSDSGIFDYFANEIFDHMDHESQQVLLKCAFLPRVTPNQAEALTSVVKAGRVLTELNARGYFTVQHAVESYQLHPLFRAFLLARAKATYEDAELAAIQKRAAFLLDAEGEIPEAMSLFAEARAWDDLAATLQRHAQTLLHQGRVQTLENWLRALPVENLSRDPWLLHFLALCRIPFNPAEARIYLEDSFVGFRSRDDKQGMCLTWAAIIDTFVYEQGDFHSVDRWIGEMEQLLQENPAFPDPETEARVAMGMMNALMWRQSWHPRLPWWADQVMSIMLKSDNGALRLALGNGLLMYHIWAGSHAKAAFIIDTLRPLERTASNNPLAAQYWLLMYAMRAWHRADHDACISAVAQVTALGEETGVRLLEHTVCAHGVINALSQGDYTMADDLLARIVPLIDSPRKLDRALYHLLAASLAWHRCDLQSAVEYGKEAVRLADECGFPLAESLTRSELALTLFELGHYREAEKELERAFTASVGLTHLEFLCRLFRSWFSLERGDRERGVEFLREALAIAAKEDYVNFSRWQPKMMAKICAIALEHGIETEYVRRLITIRKLEPPIEDTMNLDAWPWPIKIRALGSLTIERDGVPLSFTGKVQRQPLMLLKLLIAFGGREVPEARLVDVLWPDTPGDLAHKSVENNLGRLRKLLENERAVVLRDNRLSLNPKLCWVDTQAFEHMSLETQKTNENSSAYLSHLEKMLALYQGDFLAGEEGLTWAVSKKEELKQKYLAALSLIAQDYERKGDIEKAIGYWLNAITADSLSEVPYRNLMLCYITLGREADAVRVYRRCEQALSSGLGIEPSSVTRNLYSQLTARKA